MIKKLTSFLFFALIGTTIFAQSVTLTFTGKNAQTDEYTQLSRIIVTNITRGWSETLTYPDTIAILIAYTGIEENANNHYFGLSQNTPNPFSNNTHIDLTLTEMGAVTLELIDVNGRIVTSTHTPSLPAGSHQFQINVANAGMYFLTACQNNKKTSIKMVNNGNGQTNGIEYVGNISANPSFSTQKNGTKGAIYLPFALGDEMTYKGYAFAEGIEIEGEMITRAQSTSENIVINIPIPEFVCGTSTTTDIDGNTYNTVQMGNQCWMTESMRATKFADGTTISQGNYDDCTAPLWYYPGNDSTYKETYGLLYNWTAATNNAVVFNNTPIQGICPNGWHIPNTAEWTQMIGYVSNQTEFRCTENDPDDIAKALAATSGWKSSASDCVPGYDQNSNNATGFNAYPAGGFYNGSAGNLRYKANFWSATPEDMNNAYYYYISYDSYYIESDYCSKCRGQSVRCIRN